MNNEQLEKENKELIAEIKRLRAEIKLLREKLEKYERPEKDSGNSSMPPSSDKNKKYPPRERTGKKAGGQKGHKGNTKLMTDNPDEIIELYPEKCTCCGENHFIKKEKILEKRQIFDIPEIKPFVVEYQQKAGICTKCGSRNTGNFPVNAPVNFGTRITGIIGYLNVQHHVSYGRLTDIFQDLLGFDISKGSIGNKINELAKILNPIYSEIQEEIKHSKVIGSDETGSRIEGKNAFQWVFQNDLLSFFKSSDSRGFKVIEETIGNKFNGFWVSDRFAAQLKVKSAHQLCLAHLLRECKYIEQAVNSKWARKLRKLLKNIINFRKSKENYDPFDPETFRIIQKLKRVLSEIFSKIPSKNLEKKLFKGLMGRQNQLILFLDNPDVPFDNNGSERALRNRVIKRKVSGGFRSFNGAVCHDIIASVIDTVKKQGLNVFQTLCSILNGNQLLLSS
jgi:transposase